MSSLFESDKPKEDIDEEAEARRLAALERSRAARSREAFLARQELLGPVQLRAPGIRRK